MFECINSYVFLTGYIIKMSRTVLDLEEWELVLAKMHRHHANVAQEVAIIVQTIRKEMKSELVPLAEEKATYGKVQSCPFLCLQSDKKIVIKMFALILFLISTYSFFFHKGACTNHVDKIWGIFDPPLTFVDTFTK